MEEGSNETRQRLPVIRRAPKITHPRRDVLGHERARVIRKAGWRRRRARQTKVAHLSVTDGPEE